MAFKNHFLAWLPLSAGPSRSEPFMSEKPKPPKTSAKSMQTLPHFNPLEHTRDPLLHNIYREAFRMNPSERELALIMLKTINVWGGLKKAA